jgi:fatty-acid desaturase
VAYHRCSCRRRRRTDVIALYPLHSDIGSLESDVFVASVRRGGVGVSVAYHRCSCRRRRRTDVIALYPLHSDIGSLESDVFVASVRRGGVGVSVAYHRSSCRRRRRTDVIAQNPSTLTWDGGGKRRQKAMSEPPKTQPLHR